jgi:hypothetical protein
MGTFSYEFEIHDFQPDMSFEHWWLEMDPNSFHPFLEQLGNHKNAVVDGKLCCRLKVKGRLSPIGKHGHFGQWKRKLIVDEVVEYDIIPKD